MKTAISRPYESAWDDRDYLLDYKSVDLETLKLVDILGVPVTNASRDEAVALILDLVEKKDGPHHVMFLNPLKLMKIRPKKRLDFVQTQARLILPDESGILWAAARLNQPLKERIPMIALIMDIVRLAVKRDLTIYLLGSKQEYLEKVFFNLQRSFPGVRIIGRQGGHFDAKREEMVKESLRKSSPDIIFLGMGFPEQEKWIRDNMDCLSKAVVLGVDGAFDVLSGREKKAPDWFQLRGLNWLWRTISRPYRIGRFLSMLKYVILVTFKSFGKRPV